MGSHAARTERLQDARRKFFASGAHYVVDTLLELNEVLDQIESRLRAGERP